MKLSIYIPALNRDQLFTRCLKSVERSIAVSGADALEHEIIVVEGVSPVSAARNEGLRRASGEWIATVDADDEVTEDWFVEICRAICSAESDDKGIDDIVFDMTVVESHRSYDDCYGRESVVRSEVMVADLLRNLRIGNYLWRHVSRRRLWQDERFDDMRVLEDYMTLPRVIARARNVRYVAKSLYRHIARADSICATSSISEILEVGFSRARQYGDAASIGACRFAYDALYDRVDRDGSSRRWIRRHLPLVLADREVNWKWKLKFLLASLGIVVRRPR